MSKVEILNLNGEKVKDRKLKDNIFGIEPNEAVLHDAILVKRSSDRQASASTKTRSEVSGGGRKPWRQKGTGNARQGSIRATQWRGGGIVFGPTPNRNYKRRQNKKERRLAILSALSDKALNQEIIVMEQIQLDSCKTKEMVQLFHKLKIQDDKILVVLEKLSENVCLASRNLPNVKVVTFDEVNAYDLVNADHMLITEVALDKLEEVLG